MEQHSLNSFIVVPVKNSKLIPRLLKSMSMHIAIGPKPATRESAVLMLSDAVESASRSLVEPTPSRIAGLVHDLAMKRLLDGQFDDCGLTLQELEKLNNPL